LKPAFGQRGSVSRSSAQTSVNRNNINASRNVNTNRNYNENVNVNRNGNVNRDVNVNVSGGYYAGGRCYTP
jgi:hypothetical protein